MKAVIYSRVSTDEQTTANQIPVLNNWASQLRMFDPQNPGCEPMEIIEVYHENESAWSGGHQKELSRLLSDAARGKFKRVLVWALDRLTREGIYQQFSLMKKLSSFGVLVYSYQELWTLTPGQESYDLLLAIAGYVAQGTSKRISERTKAGLARKIREGWTPGRPPGSKDKKKRVRSRT